MKKTAVIINTIIFTLCSLLYVIVVESLGSGTSAFKVSDFSTLMGGYFHYVALFALLTIVLMYFLKSISIYLFAILGCIISLYSFILFYQTFNKLILMLSFVFCVAYFYFYLMARMEFDAAYYNPLFDIKFLKSYHRDHLKVSLSNSSGSKIFFLTNWAEDGFFCRGERDYPTGKVDIRIHYKGVEFSDSGTVVSHHSSGLGVKINDKQKRQKLGWSNFYDIILELGLNPTV